MQIRIRDYTLKYALRSTFKHRNLISGKGNEPTIFIFRIKIKRFIYVFLINYINFVFNK